MIGDGDVLVAALPCRLRHLVDSAAAVGFDRVHVYFATQFLYRNQLGQPVLGCSLDLTATLTQLRRNKIQV